MDNAKTQPPAVTGNATASALEAGRRLALELKPHPLGKRFAPYTIVRLEDGVEDRCGDQSWREADWLCGVVTWSTRLSERLLRRRQYEQT